MKILKPQYISIKKEHNNDRIISYDNLGNVLSKFSSEVWDFSSYIHNLNAAPSRCMIKFTSKFKNGTTLLDSENKQFLEEVKEYLYVRFHIVSPQSGKTLTPQSLIGNWHNLKSLINYLHSQNLNSFTQVTPKLALRYVEFIKSGINNRITSAMMLKHFSILEKLYLFKSELNNTINEHPWPNHTAYFFANEEDQSQTKAFQQTPRIPDDLCATLFTSALSIIEDKSPKVINVFKYMNDLIDLDFDEQILKNNRTKALSDKRPHVHAEYLILKKYGVKNKIKKKLLDNGFINLTEYKKILTLVRTACYIVIALLTGMRNSEIASLKRGAFYKSKGWDDEEYCWLKGITYKLEADPKPAKWMVPESVELAIKHLTNMSEQYNRYILRSLNYLDTNTHQRQKNSLDYLFLTKDLNTSSYGVLSNQHFNKSLSDYSKVLNLEVTDSNNDLSITKGNLWILRSHQFRRTFACLAARSALGDLRYLREHFKHWSLDMTLHYASNLLFDDSLFDEVLSERNELQSLIVSDWIKSDEPLLGGRGKSIAIFRNRGVLKTAKNLPNLLNKISDSVFVRGTGHSWCLASGDGCGGEGIYDAIQCVDCVNGVIDKSHIPIWKGLKQQHELLLNMPDSGVGTKERAREYIKKSEELIDRLTV
tara:strand:- start:9755 stop:11704 length:1950 start_codon:yes stop_codon:yes gene_type:complete